MANIIVKRYEHFNRSMGKYISSKAQYDNEMARGNYIPQDKADAIAKSVQDKKTKKYTASADTYALIDAAKVQKDGTIKLSDRAIDAHLARSGGRGYDKSKLPKDLPLEGGGYEG